MSLNQVSTHLITWKLGKPCLLFTDPVVTSSFWRQQRRRQNRTGVFSHAAWHDSNELAVCAVYSTFANYAYQRNQNLIYDVRMRQLELDSPYFRSLERERAIILMVILRLVCHRCCLRERNDLKPIDRPRPSTYASRSILDPISWDMLCLICFHVIGS